MQTRLTSLCASIPLSISLASCSGPFAPGPTVGQSGGALTGLSPTAQHEGENPGVLRAGRMASVAIDPNDASHAVAVADSGGVYVSTDGGQTWEGTVKADGSAGAFGHGFEGSGIRRFFDVAIGTDGTMLLVASAGANEPQGVWRSTDGGAHWSRPINPGPVDPIEDPAHIVFSPTPHMVYAVAGSPEAGIPGPFLHLGSQVGISSDDGASFVWFDPITVKGKFGPHHLHLPLAGLDVSPPNSFLPNVFGEVAGGGASDVLAFCARLGDQRRQVVFYNVHDGAVLRQDAPLANGNIKGGYCQVAFDPTTSLHTFVASWSSKHDSLAEGIVGADGHTMAWTDMQAPVFPNDRPPFVQVRLTSNNQLAVYYHNSGDLFRASCASTPCAAVNWPQAHLNTLHTDSARVAFAAGDSCPALIADDGGIELGLNCGAQFSASIAGLHAQEMWNASFSGSAALTTVLFALQDNGVYFLARDDDDSGANGAGLPQSTPWFEVRGSDGFWSRQFRTDRTAAVAGGNFDTILATHLDSSTPSLVTLGKPDATAGKPLREKGGSPATVFLDKQVLLMAVIGTSGRLQMFESSGGGPFAPVGNPSVPIGNGADPRGQLFTAGETAPGGGASVFAIQGTNFWLWDTLTQNWTQLVGPKIPVTVWGDSVDAGHAYALDSGGQVWRTNGGALLWKQDPALTAAASGFGKYAQIVDNDLELLPCGTRQLCTVAFDPVHPGTIAAGTAHAGIMISTDDGATWAPAPPVPEPNGGVIGLYFDPGAGASFENGLAAIWGQGLWAVDLKPAIPPPPIVQNACGGTFPLNAAPGTPCQELGKCGHWKCLGPNADAVTCNTDNGTHNECGGCGPLPIPGSGFGGKGDQCICNDPGLTSGVLVCGTNGKLVCCPCNNAPDCGPGPPPLPGPGANSP
jgi:hypothetical protein